MIKATLILSLVLSLAVMHINAQHSMVKGAFDKDSISIGDEINYTLSYIHESHLQVIFPDSLYDYLPFELLSKQASASITVGNQTKDSAIYRLRFFSKDTLIYFTLPVFILNSTGDSSKLLATTDSLKVFRYIQQDTKTLSPKPYLKNYRLAQQFNYPYYLFISAVVLFVSAIVFFILRKNIAWRYRLWTLSRSHSTYLKNLDKLLRNTNAKFKINSAEQVIADWKIYLSKLENLPINTYTTPEIGSIFNNTELESALQEFDKIIYGSTTEANIEQLVSILKKFATQRFQRKRKELKYV